MAAADDLDVVDESQPVLSLELLGVATTPTHDTAGGTVGMAPQRGAERYCRRERAFARGPLLVRLVNANIA